MADPGAGALDKLEIITGRNPAITDFQGLFDRLYLPQIDIPDIPEITVVGRVAPPAPPSINIQIPNVNYPTPIGSNAPYGVGTPKPPARVTPPPPPAPKPTPPPELPELQVQAPRGGAAAAGLAGAVTMAIAYGIGQLFDYAALPRRGEPARPVRSTTPPKINPVPIEVGNVPDLDYAAEEEVPMLPDYTVTAPRNPGYVLPDVPFEFTPNPEPGRMREVDTRGAPFHVPLLAPAISPARGQPRVQTAPRTVTLPGTKPGPGVKPVPSAPAAPGAPATPGTAPATPRTSTPSKPGQSPGSLTGSQAGAVPSSSPEPSPLGSVPRPSPASQSSTCQCPSTKTKEEKKKHGCGQGYYRETMEGITYKQWSTRKCPSSKTNSQSQRQARPITS